MIARKEGRVVRRLEVVCTDDEAAALAAAGFDTDKLRWREGYKVKLCAEERDALMLSRGALASPPKPDVTISPVREKHAARYGRVQRAAFDENGRPAPVASIVAALLETPEWRGSEVVYGADARGRAGVELRHPKARARVWLPAEGRS